MMATFWFSFALVGVVYVYLFYAAWKRHADYKKVAAKCDREREFKR